MTTHGPLRTHLEFRERDHLMLYCGSARLVVAALSGNSIRCIANAAYTKLPSSRPLMREWHVGEPGLEEALHAYLAEVRFTVGKEGLAQAAWHAVTSPWCSFDHEAAFGYSDTRTREGSLALDALDRAEAAVTAAVAADRSSWSDPPPRRVQNNRDQLAVDSRGRLVVVELKHAGSSAGLFYGPLQLLRYLHEDALHLESLLPDLQALLAQKRDLGILPPGTPDLVPTLRPVIAWGEGDPSPEVLRRLRVVLEVVNQHLPRNAMPVEVWRLNAGRPVQVW